MLITLKTLDELVDYLVARRRKLDLSGAEVARRMGKGSSTVHRLENRQRSPRFDLLQLYAKALGVDLEFSLHFDEPNAALGTGWPSVTVTDRGYQ